MQDTITWLIHSVAGIYQKTKSIYPNSHCHALLIRFQGKAQISFGTFDHVARPPCGTAQLIEAPGAETPL